MSLSGFFSITKIVQLKAQDYRKHLGKVQEWNILRQLSHIKWLSVSDFLRLLLIWPTPTFFESSSSTFTTCKILVHLVQIRRSRLYTFFSNDTQKSIGNKKGLLARLTGHKWTRNTQKWYTRKKERFFFKARNRNFDFPKK